MRMYITSSVIDIGPVVRQIWSMEIRLTSATANVWRMAAEEEPFPLLSTVSHRPGLISRKGQNTPTRRSV